MPKPTKQKLAAIFEHPGPNISIRGSARLQVINVLLTTSEVISEVGMVDQARLRAFPPKHIIRVGVMILLEDIQDVSAGASRLMKRRPAFWKDKLLTLRRVLGCRVDWITSEISRPWHMRTLLGTADIFKSSYVRCGSYPFTYFV